VQGSGACEGGQLDILKAGTDAEIDATFATLVQHHPARFSLPACLSGRREQLAARAERYSVPVIYDAREFAEAGGFDQLWSKPPGRLASGWHLPRKDLKRRQARRSARLPIDQPSSWSSISRPPKALVSRCAIDPRRAERVIE